MATVTILGKLGKDVELKDIDGKRLAKFSIADNVGKTRSSTKPVFYF